MCVRSRPIAATGASAPVSRVTRSPPAPSSRSTSSRAAPSGSFPRRGHGRRSPSAHRRRRTSRGPSPWSSAALTTAPTRVPAAASAMSAWRSSPSPRDRTPPQRPRLRRHPASRSAFAPWRPATASAATAESGRMNRGPLPTTSSSTASRRSVRPEWTATASVRASDSRRPGPSASAMSPTGSARRDGARTGPRRADPPHDGAP